MKDSGPTCLGRKVEMQWENMDEIISLSDFSSIDVKKEITSFADEKLSERLRRSFYYSPNKAPTQDTLSFSLTKEAVESFRKAAPAPFHKVGHHYAARVARDACVSPCAFLVALIYVERLARCNPDYLRNVSSSDLFIISMMVASKYLYDEGSVDEVYNDEWANSGMMETSYINELEAKFLEAIDWKVFVKPHEFRQTLQMMEARLALSNSLKRGWMSYTDLSNLLQSNRVAGSFKGVAHLLVQVTFACTAVYASLVSLWIWTLLIVNNKQTNTLPSSSNVSSPIHHHVLSPETTQLNTDEIESMHSISEDNSSRYLHVTIDNFNDIVDKEDNVTEEAVPQAKKPYSVMALLETVFFLSTATQNIIDTGPPSVHDPDDMGNNGNGKCNNCGRSLNNRQHQKKPTPFLTQRTNPVIANSFISEGLNPTCSLNDHIRSVVSPVVGYHAYQSPQNTIRDVTHYHCTISNHHHVNHHTASHPRIPSAFDSRAYLSFIAAYVSPVFVRHLKFLTSVSGYLSILFLSAFVGFYSGKWYSVRDQFVFVE